MLPHLGTAVSCNNITNASGCSCLFALFYGDLEPSSSCSGLKSKQSKQEAIAQVVAFRSAVGFVAIPNSKGERQKVGFLIKVKAVNRFDLKIYIKHEK
jgi:hypothetical protein